MASLAWRAGVGLARRYAVPVIKSGARIAQRYISRAAARSAPRIGGSIPLRTLGRGASSRGGFATMRGMGTRAFAPRAASGGGSAAASTSKYWKWGKSAAKYGAGGYVVDKAITSASDSLNKKRKIEKQGKRAVNNRPEQKAVGDSGDDIKTKDSFTHNTGTKVWQKHALISGKMQIKNGTTGGLLGTQGRAVWGFIRYKPWATADADTWCTTGGLQQNDIDTQVNWTNNNDGLGGDPFWQTGQTKFQLGYLDRKFVYEKSNFYVEFKNQSSSPVHLEYYVIAYEHSGDGRSIWEDVRDGYSAQAGDQTPVLPTLTTATSANESRMTTNIQDTLGRSSVFRKNWNIIYKHKVRMPEGGVHEFTYTNNANRMINWSSLIKRNENNNLIVTNMDAIAGITYHIIYKIYGEIGDNSKLINTVNAAGVSTGDAKVIYRSLCTETVRHCMAAPKLVIDKTTALPTDLTNLYEKDGGTGNVDDIMLEEQP